MDLKTQLANIAKKIQPKIDKIMYDEIATDIIEDIAKPNVQTEVYDKYPEPEFPKKYFRTRGLKENWFKFKEKGRIRVKNIRFEGTKNITKVVETGDGYDFQFPYYGVPRPFIAKTKLDIFRQKKKYVEMLRKGLGKMGIMTQQP